ncbi:MAG: Sir2 family NAD-dependent protein deacetylase [Actinomycetota bacterium]
MDVDALDSAHDLIDQATAICVLSGAGLSTDSGIPDFRGPNGLWTSDPGAEMLSSYDAYVTSEEVRKAAWQHRLHSPLWSAQPNRGHHAIVDRERQGRLLGIVTQNIDGLHQRAGSEPTLVIEVHGSAHRSTCLTCGEELPIEQVLERVAAGEVDPRCSHRNGSQRCDGILKSSTISFGQALRPESMEHALTLATTCDVLLAVGTTLAVYPVASIVPKAQESGARVVIINRGPTALDALADVLVDGALSDVLPHVLARKASTS